MPALLRCAKVAESVLVLADALDRLQLGDRLRQLGFGGRVTDITVAILERFLGAAAGVDGLGFVEVVRADRSRRAA